MDRVNSTAKFLISAIFIFALPQFAQVTITQNLPILAGINDSSISVTVDPPISPGDLAKIFDGNPFSQASIASPTLTITLGFENPPQFSESKVFFLNQGNWTLETANSLDDLNNQTGSYQLLVNNRPHPFLSWDSVGFIPQNPAYMRLGAVNSWAGNMMVGEWALESALTIVSLYITPNPPKLIPNSSLKVRVKLLDQNNRLHPYTFNDPFIWSSDDPAVATAAGNTIYGVGLGNTRVNVQTETLPLSGSAAVQVLPDFQSPNAPSKTVKVALVLQNPVTGNGQRLHQRFNWINPMFLVSQLKEEFYTASDGVINFTMVDTLDDPFLFTRYYGEFITLDSLVAYYSQPGWPKLVNALNAGQLQFDYNALIDFYDLCTRRDNGEIDEVWVYAHPYASMYESRLAGQNAFWWNSPPLTGTSCIKLLSIMGFNYERGVPEAMESMGHRAESALWAAFGRWNVHHPDPNAWEIYTTIDKEIPGKGHVGNIHYPVNGLSDYDFSNTRYVITYADNWKRYPYLLDQTRTVNCLEWNCGHLGYMRWWYAHLPRFTGVSDSTLNNWWMYFIDYEAAVDSAHAQAGIVGIAQPLEGKALPRAYLLEQNYPNPFNPATTIRFSLPQAGLVKLKIFDVLGREVKTLLNERMNSGEYSLEFDASGLASGIYFYRLSVTPPLKGGRGDVQTRKMVVMK